MLFEQTARIYTALKKRQSMPAIKAGSRAASMVYSRMSLWNKLGAWLLLKNISRLKEETDFCLWKKNM